MGMLCFQIDRIPDLSLNKYQSLADVGVEGVLKRHEDFLRQWHGICIASETSFHLLYVYLPAETISKRMKIYFLIQGNEESLQLVEPLLHRSPLSDFFQFEKASIPDICLCAGATLTKKERIAEIYNPKNGQNKFVHYVPKWSVNEQARLYDLFRSMETIGKSYIPQEACVFRVDVYPDSLASDTRIKFKPILKELRGENDIWLMRETESMKTDSYAKDICKEYEDWITSIETNPHFRVNIYSFASNIFKAKMLLNAAGAEALEKGDFSIASRDGKFDALSRLDKKAKDYCAYPEKKDVLQSWSTTYCLSELVPFFRFPTLYEGENIEIAKETAPIQLEHGIYWGKDMNDYPVYIALEDMPKHAFFTGMPGAGKTNTMLHLISQLRAKDIPFLVMEPAKKEYRALLSQNEMKDVYLFSPHLQSKFPLHINPLEFPKGVRLSEHINALLQTFKGSFVLEGPTYKFLSSAIQRSYIDLGWDIEDENGEEYELSYPSLQDVYDNLEQEIDRYDYNAEIKGNVKSFLQVRLGGLMELDAGELFNVSFSTLKPEEWLEVCAIVELEVLDEQAKNFFVLLMCHYVLETLKANPTGGIDKKGKLMPVRHVMFIEEAHNIIASTSQQEGNDFINPKVSATEYIIKMLAEVRARREAIVIADQIPTALTSEVVKNTNLKIVHRLTAQDDREEIGRAISASPLQLEQMATFTKGRAFIYHEKTMKTYEIQVAEWKKQEITFDYTNDSQLYLQIYQNETIRKAIAIAFHNWQKNVLFKVDEEIVELQKRFIEAMDYAENINCKSSKKRLLLICKNLEVQIKRFERLWNLSEDTSLELWEKYKETKLYIEGMINRLEMIL